MIGKFCSQKGDNNHTRLEMVTLGKTKIAIQAWKGQLLKGTNIQRRFEKIVKQVWKGWL